MIYAVRAGKQCPRCDIGSMFLDERDDYACLQCGYRYYTRGLLPQKEVDKERTHPRLRNRGPRTQKIRL